MDTFFLFLLSCDSMMRMKLTFCCCLFSLCVQCTFRRAVRRNAPSGIQQTGSSSFAAHEMTPASPLASHSALPHSRGDRHRSGRNDSGGGGGGGTLSSEIHHADSLLMMGTDSSLLPAMEYESFPAEVSVSMSALGHSIVFTCFIRDITIKESQLRLLATEKHKSIELLLNILPPHVVNRLKVLRFFSFSFSVF